MSSTAQTSQWKYVEWVEVTMCLISSYKQKNKPKKKNQEKKNSLTRWSLNSLPIDPGISAIQSSR